MQPQASARRDGIVVAHGYGLKLYVHHGHLVVHDGIGRSRQTRRYNRATSKLKRVVVIGHTGYVTFEALRWIRDVGAAFVQVGADSELIAVSAPARHHESKLRRAQALATDTHTGRLAVVQLLRAKLEHQAQIAERLSHLKPTVRVKDARPIAVADAIRSHAETMTADRPLPKLRLMESMAGRNYWQVLARLPLAYERGWGEHVPDHWHFAGARTSRVDKKRPRLAQTPAHAVINYLYAMLETEAITAAHALGFDPSLGIMHTDLRYRSSLAMDLMEPARPAADEVALALLSERRLSRGDVVETRRGTCRLGPNLTQDLAHAGHTLRRAVAPHAERLARTLLRTPHHPTPLTRRRHAQATASPA